MIRGIGTDIADIGRIEGLIEKYGVHFLSKVFTAAEIDYCEKMARPAIHFAGRWAAKEAFYKALPENCQPHSGWKGIEVVPAEGSRRPSIRVLSENLKAVLAGERVSECHVSISHERSYCVAVVAIE